MKRKYFLIVLVFVFLQFTGFVHSAIPASERAALIALYNSTNGDGWLFNSGWKTQPLHTDGFAMPGTEGSWFGVTLSGDSVSDIALNSNRLSGSIPSQIGDFSNLTNLSLDHNQLGGSIPTQIANLSQLRYLHLGGNSLSGSIPSQLGNLSNLGYINLWANGLSGSIPSQLGNLNKLWALVLASNNLTGNIPSQLGNLSNLSELSLQGTGLSGSIPPQLGKLTQLSILSLSHNRLSGSIPSELGNLTNLNWFELGENQLSGSIPSQLGNLTKLAYINLGFNQLSGGIPSQLGNLGQAFYFDLSNNELSGGIPSQLGNLSNLEHFGLDRNNLNGIIPTSLTNLTKVTDFDIGFNCLSATDSILRAWLNIYDPDWETTQCLSVPVITTNAISSVTSTSAVCGGNVVSDGGSPITGRGVCWSTVTNPKVGDSSTTDGTGTGSFTSTITDLSANTTYYVRAYASSIIGTAYGSTISFATPNNLPEIDPPFGSFDTPVDGSTVAGSIAITGWALDDGGLESVKIYLIQGNAHTYIDSALFVEGARPDVAAAYPEYPTNTKAGWGYMMLTNFLPGEGNGTFVLSVVATDLIGKTMTLGTKTIKVDNAHSVKPFGAIDTPIQGGTTTGSSFVNWGWVLTPQPNSIPTNGSTISVWVNGVNKGHPTYNIYRSDIAALFPGYANSSGAVGHFYLDTTKYANGVHIIQWTATDNAGNSDGIGSRYFNIQNTSSDRAQNVTSPLMKMNLRQISTLSENFSEPIKFSKGFYVDNESQELLPDEKGNNQFTIKELEPVRIQLGDHFADIQGYLISGNQLNKFPIGSTLDVKSGTFSWSPGPGFLGSYSLVFVLTDSNGHSFKKTIEIKIEPKFTDIQHPPFYKLFYN